ncbi:FAD-binding protein, partial [Devosia sp.]|uniref:FAD-binding protein n=1 Tax=Devosia sp. TaxID=1871048 RepID=UPI002AFE5C10
RGIPWLIVRPSVVTGPGMNWSTGMVEAMRKIPVGLGGRTINLIHVTDLSLHLKSLIEQGISGEVFNLADNDVKSGDFFAAAAQAAGRKALILPGAITATAGRLMPSTMWFFAHDIEMRSDKLKGVSQHKASRALAGHFTSLRADRTGARIEDILDNARAGRHYQATGHGYSRWFQDAPLTDTLSLARYEGIVRHEGQSVTVLAGTRLSALISFLDQQGQALATLPEFVGVSAGACFFTEVHGSSSTHATLYDLVEAIRYVDDSGEEHESRRDVALWDRLRQRADGITLTEITFRCVPQHYLANVIQWRDETELDAIIAGGYAENAATTLHWFPGHKTFLIYNINPVERPTPDDQAPFLPMRGLPYSLQRLVLKLRMPRGRRVVGKSHEVLGTWRSVPARPLVGAILKRMRPRFRNMELCIPIAMAPAFIARLREEMARGAITFPKEQGIGIRFSTHAASARTFMWVETSSADEAQLHALADLARSVCGDAFRLHKGKYVPRGIGPEQLFIPRAG